MMGKFRRLIGLIGCNMKIISRGQYAGMAHLAPGLICRNEKRKPARVRCSYGKRGRYY